MAFGLKTLNHTGNETPDKFFSDLKSDMSILDKLDGQVALSGTATGGTTTSLTDTSLTLGTNALVGTFILVWRNGAMVRAEQVTANTATTISFAAGATVAAGDAYSIFANANAIPVAEKGALNGVATLDATGKVVERLSYEGTANGVATLDPAGLVIQRNVAEGAPSGVATLDANAELAQAPAGASATAATNPEAKLRADGGWAIPLAAHVGAATASTAANATWTKVRLDSIVSNPANITISANQLTVPTASPWVGAYCVLSAGVHVPALSAKVVGARIVRNRGGNAVPIAFTYDTQGTTANIARRLNLSSPAIYLQAGDIFYVEFYQNSGAGVQHNTGNYSTWLSIHAVGSN